MMTDRQRGLVLENQGYRITVYDRNGQEVRYGLERVLNHFIERTEDGRITHTSELKLKLDSGREIAELTPEMGKALSKTSLGYNPYDANEPKYLFVEGG